MLELRLTPMAIRDLENIWLYTARRWSIEQANIYQDELYKGLTYIVSNPQIGTQIDDIRRGYRRYKVKRHDIFYVVSDQIVSIVRILHERMNISGRIG